MTRFFLVLFLALAAGGTFLAVRWLLGDEGGGRQTGRAEGLEGEPDRRRRDEREEGRAERAGTSAGEADLGGFVTDTSGAPIEGARIRFDGRTVVTDSEGAYRFGPVGTTGVVRAEARGYFPASSARAERVDFQLMRAAVLFGTVVDEAGRPVRGAQAYLISAEHQILDPGRDAPVASTDEKGEYLFPGVAAGVTDVGVRAEGYLPQVSQDFRIAGLQEHRLDFVLRRGRSVTVELLDRAKGVAPRVRISDSRLRGKLLPPGGLELLARSLPGRALAGFPVIERDFPEENPRMTVHGLPAGAVDIELTVPELVLRVPKEEPVWFVAEEGIGKFLDNTDPEVALRLLPAGLVAPVVRDALSNELLFPKVTRLADQKGPMPVDVRVEDKLYVVPTDPRRHVLRFELAGYETKDVELPAERKGILDLPVLLQPLAGAATGSLRIVFDPKLEGRLGGVGRGEAGARQFEAKRDRKGDWIVEKIPAGTWDFTLLASKMVPAKVPGVTVAAGATQEVRVALYAGGGMELKVVDTKGELLDKVTLDLRDPSNERIDIHFVTMVSGERGFTSINYIPSAATAKADSGLAPGSYTLWAGRDGYEVGKAEFVVAGTDVAEVTVVLAKK